MLLIPSAIWNTLRDEFRSTSPALEQVAYLEGVRLDAIAVVTTISFPTVQATPGSYTVDASAAQETTRVIRPLGLTRLAQVHTHPGGSVRHSDIDDALAYSQKPGSISLVIGNGGRQRIGIEDCGVHVRFTDGWKLISPHEAEVHARIVPSFFDFRATGVPSAKRERWWQRIWRRSE